MPTPTNRTPVRIARGTYSDLNTSIADIQEGEICYAQDEDKLYVKESGSLVAPGLTSSDVGVTVQGYDVDTAKTDTAQTFTAPQRGAVQGVGSSANITLDFSLGNNFATTLTSPATLTPANPVSGQHGVYVITQDGTGGHTMAFDSVFKFPGGVAPSLTTAAGSVDVLVYYVESGGNRITCRLLNDVK